MKKPVSFNRKLTVWGQSDVSIVRRDGIKSDVTIVRLNVSSNIPNTGNGFEQLSKHPLPFPSHTHVCTDAHYVVPCVNSSDIGLLTRRTIETFGVITRRTIVASDPS